MRGRYKVVDRVKAPPLIDCTQCKHYRPGLSELSIPFFEIYEDLNRESFCGECVYSELPIQKGMMCDKLERG